MRISFLRKQIADCTEEKGKRRKRSRSLRGEKQVMFEDIFNEILDSLDGDYINQVRILAIMKPTGW